MIARHRREEEIVVAHENLYERSVRRFNAAINGEGEPAATAHDGLCSLAVALAALESARTGCVDTKKLLAERGTWSEAERAAALERLKDENAFVRRAAADALGRKGVPNRVDDWGDRYDHDWPTWWEMLPLYLDDLVP